MLRDSLAISRELGHRVGEAVSLNNLGRVHQELGQYREAIACHRDSIALFRELHHRHDQAEALRDLGDALLEAGRAQEAGEAWQEALILSERLQIPEKFKLRQRLAGSHRYGQAGKKLQDGVAQ